MSGGRPKRYKRTCPKCYGTNTSKVYARRNGIFLVLADTHFCFDCEEQYTK